MKVILDLNNETIARLNDGGQSSQGLEILGMEFEEAWGKKNARLELKEAHDIGKAVIATFGLKKNQRGFYSGNSKTPADVARELFAIINGGAFTVDSRE